MRKLKFNFAKFFLFILAVIMPISVTGVVGTFLQNSVKSASAESSSTTYYLNLVEDVSLTNNNFASSTVNSLSQNPSGWTKQVSDGNSTSGVINVGDVFENYRNSSSGAYYLSANPGRRGNDNQILMINSKTKMENVNEAYQGYSSSSVTLSANSFYSFQVAFKSDTNYDEDFVYTARGGSSGVTNDVSITQSNFNSEKFVEGEDVYVQMTYKGTTYYAKKELTNAGTFADSTKSERAFYYDGTYVGFLHDLTSDDEDKTKTPIYVKLDDAIQIEVPHGVNMITNPDNTSSTTSFDEDYSADISEFTEYESYLRFEKDGITYYISKLNVNYILKENATYYTSNLTFKPSNNSLTSGSYTLSKGSQYYSRKIDLVSRNEYGKGSIYLNGLKNDKGESVALSYEKVLSTGWKTFYFFVATGDEEQTVNLDLWLGADPENSTSVTSIASTGVVFFDDIKVQRYSENYFYETYFDYLENNSGENNVKLSYLKNNNNINFSEDYNFDFERSDITALKGFKQTAGNGNAQIVRLNKDSFELSTGHPFAGSNLGVYEEFDENTTLIVKKNSQALALWADNDYVEVTSKNPIEIDMHKMYEITVDYKLINVTGSAYLKIQENDTVQIENGLNDELYPLSNGTATASSKGASNFNNKYNSVSIFVKGSNLYNSEINLTLALGSSEENATGCVVFDDIKVKEVTSEVFDEAETKVELGARTPTLTIENGEFNITQNTDLSYPLLPASWTIEKDDGLFAGVINTKESEYEKYKLEADKYTEDSENPYLWAKYPNPKNTDNETYSSSNILMLANLQEGSQKVTSPNFTLEANSFYEFKFFNKIRSLSGILSYKISVLTDQNILLFEDEVENNNVWEEYKIYFSTFKGAETVHIVIEFETDQNVNGFVFFDKFNLVNIDAIDFNSLPEFANKVDLQNNYLNLPTNEISNTIHDLPTNSAYKGSLNSEDSFGGIVYDDYFENNDHFKIEKENDENIEVFVIQTNKEVSHTIEGQFNYDLSSGGYYKLSFTLKTKFVYNGSNGDEDFDIDEHKYGATVGLTGFDYMTELKSNDEYQTYTLYIHPTEDTTAHLYFSLVSDHPLTTGTMAVYNVQFEDITPSEEDSEPQEYTNAVETIGKDDYNVNSSLVAVGNEVDAEEETPGEDDSNAEEKPNDYSWLLYVSSIITALAIIVAILGYYLRKIKIKKIETKRSETYDRKGSLHKDVIRQEAEQERVKEVKELEENIKKFETELENIEKEHKEKVVSMRKDENKVVSKTTEKEFKLFAQKRDVIAEKIDILKHQLENVKSPEYLLSLERKKFMENEEKQKQLAKESKRKIKAKEEKKKGDKKK